MGKKYCTEEEAVEKLGITKKELNSCVKQQKLRAYRDGDRRMFRTEEVDKLAGESGKDSVIELSPADTTAGNGISISEANTRRPPVIKGEGSSISAKGISIFDEAELDVEPADPMAKTQIAPSLEDQIAISGVGSGSGLLDLTRESDDTSLGADVLDQIDMEGEVGGSTIGAEVLGETGPYASQQEAARPAQPTIVQAPDPTAGLFAGIIAGCTLIMLVLGGVVLAVMRRAQPGYLEIFKNNIVAVVIGSVAVVAIAAVAGYMLGKSSGSGQASQRMGG